ncbi:hypothetical protein JCM15764A_33050 [Geotalea toluenoxydans]
MLSPFGGEIERGTAAGHSAQRSAATPRTVVLASLAAGAFLEAGIFFRFEGRDPAWFAAVATERTDEVAADRGG